MAEELRPNEDQQEDRAEQANVMAEAFEQKSELKVTLKGEALEVHKNGREFVVTANGDASFSVADGPSHIGADELIEYINGA